MCLIETWLKVILMDIGLFPSIRESCWQWRRRSFNSTIFLVSARFVFPRVSTFVEITKNVTRIDGTRAYFRPRVQRFKPKYTPDCESSWYVVGATQLVYALAAPKGISFHRSRSGVALGPSNDLRISSSACRPPVPLVPGPPASTLRFIPNRVKALTP